MLVPLSALQHYLYCPRQCALIHVEQLWAENRSTAEGKILHERAHDGPSESRPGLRIARGLAVKSEKHGLTGFCDVVEIWNKTKITPIEYKRGKPKSHRADEIQLCGQALCLEETFSLPQNAIAAGYLFYGKRKRRTEVVFDPQLRSLTLDIASKVRAMIQAGKTPTATYAPRRCDACSLIDLCQPRSLSRPESAKAWFAKNLRQALQP